MRGSSQRDYLVLIYRYSKSYNISSYYILYSDPINGLQSKLESSLHEQAIIHD